MSIKQKGAIAAGHEAVVDVCSEILEEGGNAFDAAIAGMFASSFAEPVLSSLGGGGFLLAQKGVSKQKNIKITAPTLYDFFCQTPKKPRPKGQIDFRGIIIDYGTTSQEYHIGAGAIATPSMVSGAYTAHKDLCNLPMSRLLEPTIRIARNGIKQNNLQAKILNLVTPIYMDSPSAKPYFASKINPNSPLAEGELHKNPDYADFLEILAIEGKDLFYKGEIAKEITNLCKHHGGAITMDDMESYKTIRRTPFSYDFHGAKILTNPLPSSGGSLICFALELLKDIDFNHLKPDSAEWLFQLANVMDLTNQARHASGFANQIDDNNSAALKTKLFDNKFIKYHHKKLQDILKNSAEKIGGTTHISVIDANDNAASLTISNGEGCGHMLSNTGIMLNNMLGESDLFPNGFFNFTPNTRISSMMSPTIITTKDHRRFALGSGGANRIRSALTQVIASLLGFNESLEKAVTTSRIDYENNILNIEGNHKKAEIKALTSKINSKTNWKTNLWKEQDFFYGGTHTVGFDKKTKIFEAIGDKRRGGKARIVE